MLNTPKIELILSRIRQNTCLAKIRIIYILGLLSIRHTLDILLPLLSYVLFLYSWKGGNGFSTRMVPKLQITKSINPLLTTPRVVSNGKR
jgi:hypothetical protein